MIRNESDEDRESERDVFSTQLNNTVVLNGITKRVSVGYKG